MIAVPWMGVGTAGAVGVWCFVGGQERRGCAAVWHCGFTGRRGVGGASGRVNASSKQGKSHFDSQVLLKFLEPSFTPSRCEFFSLEYAILDGESPSFRSIVLLIHAAFTPSHSPSFLIVLITSAIAQLGSRKEVING